MVQALIREDGTTATYLLFMLGGQLFGIAVEDVQSVEELHDLTNVPLSGTHVGGVSQLHGHIITAIDMREALVLNRHERDGKGTSFMIEDNGHQYCILIDQVVGVFDLDLKNKDNVPETVDPSLKKIATSVLRHEGSLVLTTTTGALMEVIRVKY